MEQILNKKIFLLIADIAEKENIQVFVIGGFVRDYFLKRPSKDIDIVVIGNGIEIANKVAGNIEGKPKVAVFKNFGTAQLKFEGLDIEFVGARKESYRRTSRKPVVEEGTLEDDQNRRDFTINALALCLNKEHFGKLLDPFKGLEDLNNKIIRTPLDPEITFSDDPLRMMRAIRFATQLHFTIEEKTLEVIKRNKHRIEIVSKERITDELNKIIASDIPSVGFNYLMNTGLLEIIFPELYNLHGVEIVGDKKHKDNFLHTIRVLDNLSKTSENIWLRWAALLHDIAKPMTKKFDPKQKWTFHGHEFIGSKLIPDIFRRLKLPLNDKMKYVQKMVSLHHRPVVLSSDEVTDSAVRRLLFDAGDDINDLINLCEADITSQNRELRTKYLKNFKLVRKKLKEIEEKDAIRNFQPPITGEQIMKYFNIPPGYNVGVIKTAIKDAILDGKIKNDYQEAFDFMIKKGEELGLKGQ